MNNYNPNWHRFSQDASVTMSMVLMHPTIPWDWHGISTNPNVKMLDVLLHPCLPWDWNGLTINSNITVDDVGKSPHLPWVTELLPLNRNFANAEPGEGVEYGEDVESGDPIEDAGVQLVGMGRTDFSEDEDDEFDDIEECDTEVESDDDVDLEEEDDADDSDFEEDVESESDDDEVDPAVCPFKLIRGARRGQACGKGNLAGRTACGRHIPSAPSVMRYTGTTCEMRICGGVRKGKRCNKPAKRVGHAFLCRIHHPSTTRYDKNRPSKKLVVNH